MRPHTPRPYIRAQAQQCDSLHHAINFYTVVVYRLLRYRLPGGAFAQRRPSGVHSQTWSPDNPPL